MRIKTITEHDVKNAYLKLKNMAYYDNSNLYLKARIADFERKHYKDSFEGIFNEIAESINDFDEDWWSDEFDDLRLRALPKSLDKGKELKTSIIPNVFDNVRDKQSDTYEAKRITLFADASVEVNVLSILWLTKIGHHLEDELFDKCYGNRLVRKNVDEKKGIPKGRTLFKPYYNQYQRWRDEGIEAARERLKDNQDIIFVNLDIRDYYYSLQLKEQELTSALKKHIRSVKLENLHKLFLQFHQSYFQQISKTNYPKPELYKSKSKSVFSLPIGIPSSYVLANWYLRSFDRRVLNSVKPIYYSRYVDDLFIVLPKKRDGDKRVYRNKTLNRKFIEDYTKGGSIEREVFESLISVFDYKKLDKKDDPYEFRLRGQNELIIQPSKTLLYHFNSDWSLALLDKFKEELQERSSEFRFLPDESLITKGFNTEAYELIFDDSKYKVKTLKDYKENRYGISSYLTKRIFYTLRNGTEPNKDGDDIFRFFKGYNNLDYYQMWEKLLTLLMVNDEHEKALQFASRTCCQIETLVFNETVEQPGVMREIYDIQEDLLEYFRSAFHLAFSLNPKKNKAGKYDAQWFKKAKSTIELRNRLNFPKPRQPYELWENFRLSNMFRMHYTAVPFINYHFGSGKRDRVSLTQIDQLTSFFDGGYGITKNRKVGVDDFKLKFAPRNEKFCHIAWAECWMRVNNTEDPGEDLKRLQVDLLSVDEYEKDYLNAAFETYCLVNFGTYNPENKNEIRDSIFTYKSIGDDEVETVCHEIEVNNEETSDKLRIGIGNILVEKHRFEQSMLGWPQNEGRYNEFEPILNTAEKEKCDLIVLPELVIPYGIVNMFMEESWRKQRAIITGIEHWTVNRVSYNFILTCLPTVINGVKDAVPVIRLKNHYSPGEEFWINDYERIVPKPTPYRYNLLRWKGCYFSDYYCFELGDIYHRAHFKGMVDFIVASERNQDVNYFSNIAESTSRDIHCYFIQANSSEFGDSRITLPAKTEIKDKLRLKGGKNKVLLWEEIDIKKLREFQYKGYGQQSQDKSFKPCPPDYERRMVRARIDNKSFCNLRRINE